jgi:hypothetical protein
MGKSIIKEKPKTQDGEIIWGEIKVRRMCADRYRASNRFLGGLLDKSLEKWVLARVKDAEDKARAEGMAQGKKEVFEGFGFKHGRYKCDGGCSNEKGGSQLNGWHYYDDYGYCWCLDCVKPEAQKEGKA